MKDIKPGDVVLVKMKVNRVIITEDETEYTCIPVSSYDSCDRYLVYVNTEDIVDVINDG